MLEFLIDNLFVLFGGRVIQQTIGIPMDTNCARLLVDSFLHTYETNFLQGLLKNKDRQLAHTFNSSFRYILVDDVLSLNNSRFGDYLHRNYPNELEVKDTTDTQMSASNLTRHLEIDNGGRLQNKTKRQTRRLHFSNSQHPSHHKQDSRSTSLWNLHFTIHTLF